MHSRKSSGSMQKMMYQRADSFHKDSIDTAKKMTLSRICMYLLLFCGVIVTLALVTHSVSMEKPAQHLLFKTPSFGTQPLPSMVKYEDFPDINVHDVEAKALALLKPQEAREKTEEELEEEERKKQKREEEEIEANFLQEQKLVDEEHAKAAANAKAHANSVKDVSQVSKETLIEDSLFEAKSQISELSAMKYDSHIVMETDQFAQDRIRSAQSAIRKFLTLKYGPGPYYVKMVLEFPDSMMHEAAAGALKGSNVAATPRQEEIVIELAPIDYVPYSVYMFLEHIVKGYKTGNTCLRSGRIYSFIYCRCYACIVWANFDLVFLFHLYSGSFHRNAGHVLQAMVTVQDENNHNHHERFAWQEYSPHYPHKKYTLGYAGRPSSNGAFYISTMDNVRNHGPASQGSKTEADRWDSVRCVIAVKS